MKILGYPDGIVKKKRITEDYWTNLDKLYNMKINTEKTLQYQRNSSDAN